jgi:hypothetical protein
MKISNVGRNFVLMLMKSPQIPFILMMGNWWSNLIYVFDQRCFVDVIVCPCVVVILVDRDDVFMSRWTLVKMAKR